MKIPGVRKIVKGVLVAPLRVVEGAADAFDEYVNGTPRPENPYSVPQKPYKREDEDESRR